jgi:hypothetical protein
MAIDALWHSSSSDQLLWQSQRTFVLRDLAARANNRAVPRFGFRASVRTYFGDRRYSASRARTC